MELFNKIAVVVTVLLLAMSFPDVSVCQQITLTKGGDGWTVFTPSADSTIVYVSSSGNDDECAGYLPSNAAIGSDPFNPVSAIPCSTISKALTKTHNNMPDWILIKRGEELNQTIGYFARSGRSSTEPFLIGSYGSSGQSPVLKTGTSEGLDIASHIKWLAISGIDFYANTRDPGSPDYVDSTGSDGIFIYTPPDGTSTTEGILVEGCKFRYFKNGINIAGRTGKAFSFSFRRNLIDYTYSSTGMSSGFFSSTVDDLIIEDNIFNHNGWLIQSYDSTEADGQATPYNHNVYLSSVTGLVVRGNLLVDASSNNIKIKSLATGLGVDYLIDNNFSIGGEINISLNASDVHYGYSIVNPTASNNIWTRAGRLNPTNRNVAYFFYNFNIDGGNVFNNLMIHQQDSSISNSPRFYHMQYASRNIDIRNNIVHDTENVIPIYTTILDGDLIDRSGNTVRNNNFDTIGAYMVYSENSPGIDGLLFSGNKYNTTKTSNTWFRVLGSDKTDAQWITLTGDNSTNSTATYPDPTRDVDTYMGSIGQTATVDAFVAAARAQDRYNWDTRFTADAVNDYIRAGFGMGQRRLFRNVRVGEVEP